MEEKLLTKADLGAFFQTSADAARKLCERHGIKPLNVGNGAVARLRWRLSDVMQVLAALQAGTNIHSRDFRPRRPKDARVLGRSAQEIHKELAICQ